MVFNKFRNTVLGQGRSAARCDGLEDGHFVGWFPTDVEKITIFIEGVKVAEGLCEQIRADVKDILGINAKGFRILFDGSSIDYDWLSLDKLTVSAVALNNEKIVATTTVRPEELIADVQFYNQRPISALRQAIESSLLWDKDYYSSQLTKDREKPNDLIKDYILFGARSGKDPSAHFWTGYYLEEAENEINIHENPLVHFLDFGEALGLKPNPTFSATSYKELIADRNIGYCEFTILGGKFSMVVGWYIGDYELVDITLSLTDSAFVFAENAKIMRIYRTDVKEAFPNKKVDDCSGFMALLEMKNELEPIGKNEALSVHFLDCNGAISVSSEVTFLAGEDRNHNCSRILNSWDPESIEHQRLAENIILPMIHELYPADNSVASKRYNYGALAEQPEATVIIPLYGRFDFMRYQISNFARYQGMNNIEVIYVLDDPGLQIDARKLAAQLHTTFSFNFSLVTLEANVGFGRANNIGVEYANADNLILLNSDVLPKDGTWAEKLIDNLDNLPDAGLIGARLLFEDESIQHDGMAPMLLDQYPGLIFNDHPMKGWPVALSLNEKKPAECALVTAACVAIKKSLFEQLGGFDPAYILGDFEDSDLCLRALGSGKVNYICRDIVLNHLERLSQNLVEAGDWKHKLTLLNANTYNQRWSENLQIQLPHTLEKLRNA